MTRPCSGQQPMLCSDQQVCHPRSCACDPAMRRAAAHALLARAGLLPAHRAHPLTFSSTTSTVTFPALKDASCVAVATLCSEVQGAPCAASAGGGLKRQTCQQGGGSGRQKCQQRSVRGGEKASERRFVEANEAQA
eukprot:212648-Chlamydomonas_euryale.AAC.1